MHGLWSTALSAAVLFSWDSRAWPVMLVTADHSSHRIQHPGTPRQCWKSNQDNLGGKCGSSPHPNEQGGTELSAGLCIALRTDVSPQF